MKRTAALFAALSLIAGSAAAENYTAGSLEIDNPWMRATPRGADVASAYLTIVNKGTEAERLIGGTLTGVSRFEVHRMVVEGGVAKMRPVEGGLEIKPGQSLALTPGALHVMLIGLKQPFQQGQHIKGTLMFEKAGKVDVEFTVESIGASAPVQSVPAGTHSGH
jgi:periplasmic copper chaperone A